MTCSIDALVRGTLIPLLDALTTCGTDAVVGLLDVLLRLTFDNISAITPTHSFSTPRASSTCRVGARVGALHGAVDGAVRHHTRRVEGWKAKRLLRMASERALVEATRIVLRLAEWTVPSSAKRGALLAAATFS